MVRGENLAHKCAGTTNSKIGCLFLHQREKSERHFQTDKKAALLYLLKVGGKKNEHMIKLNHNMSITTEYLPSVLNTVVDR